MTWTAKIFVSSFALALAACTASGDGDGDGMPAPGGDAAATPLPTGNPAAGTRPSGQPNLVTKEGRIEGGVECPILRTPEGEIWALSLGEADFGPGDYVEITGEIADASFCMQGEGTLIPQRIDAKVPK